MRLPVIESVLLDRKDIVSAGAGGYLVVTLDSFPANDALTVWCYALDGTGTHPIPGLSSYATTSNAADQPRVSAMRPSPAPATTPTPRLGETSAAR